MHADKQMGGFQVDGRQAGLRQGELRRAEPGRAEPGHAEPGRTEPGHAEPGHAEPGRTEPGHAEPGRAEPRRAELGRAEPGRADPPRTEPPLTDRPDAVAEDRRTQAEDHLVELAVEVFAMFADATRLRIVLALRGGELPVNDLAQAVGKSPSAVSQHLAKLRMARLVSTRQDGTRVFYRLTNEHVRELVTDAIYQAEHVAEGLPRLHHHTADEASAPGPHSPGEPR